jgi:hypothetical protein
VNNSKNLGDLVGGSDSRGSGEKSNPNAELGSALPRKDAPSARDDDADDSNGENESSGSGGDDAAGHDRSQDTSDDKGILARLKERGQVF